MSENIKKVSKGTKISFVIENDVKKTLEEMGALEVRTLSNIVQKILKEKVDEYKKSKEIGETNE